MKLFSGNPDTVHGNADPTNLVSPIALALVCVFAMVMIVGCASQSSPSAGSQEPEQASEGVAEQESESAADADSAATAQEATEEESAPAFEDPSEDDIALYNEWADTTVSNALNNLADEGVIAEPSSDGEYLDEAFEYSGSGIAFLDENAGEELSGDFDLPAGKVVLGCFDSILSEATHSTEVFYADGNWGTDQGREPTLFYPESMFGYLDQYEMSDVLRDVPVETFANSTDECDYLIVYDGVPSSVEEDFYWGGWDRISTTTLVLVIDAKQGKVVHIENVGTDTPPAMNSDTTEGEVLKEDLAAYLNDLLLNQANS